MFFKMTIASNVKSTIPQIESAKEYMKFVKEHFRYADQLLVGTLSVELKTMKFNGSQIM